MRAAGIDATGQRIRALALPRPSSPTGEDVLVAVHAAGVGNWDELMRAGSWLSQLHGPHALGVEVAGTVIEVGPAVTSLSTGEKVAGYVFPFRAGGGWAEYQIADSRVLAHKPASVLWTGAAALPVPGLTAFQTLTEVLAVQGGQRLFVHGAGGVTGGLLVQLAAMWGLSVVVTAGRTSDARLRDYGAAAVIDRAQPDWQESVLDALAGPVDVAVNAIPGAADDVLGVVAPRGRLASIAGPATLCHQAVLTEVFVRSDGPQLGRLLDLLDRGDISIPIGRSYPLEMAATALDRVLSGTHGSAVVLDIA